MKSLALRVFCVAVLSLLAATSSFAKETTGGASKPVASTLPLCIEDEADIEKIRAAMKANPKNDFKYDGYKKALAASTDQELLSRLIYSETLAANCENENTEILPLISETIGNRVRTRKGDIKSVIYQRDQFASSLNNYPESHLLHFLCPKNATVWKLAVANAKVPTEKSERVLPRDTVNYYLYKHSSRFTPPNWKLPEAKVRDDKLASCIRFFRNSSWK